MLLDHVDWDLVWCPANGHGGNGRFFDPAIVREGYEEDMSKAPTEAAAPAADQPAKTTKQTTPGRRSPRECECGCGGMTKGGRFAAGHDAKLHSRLRKEAKAAQATA
jgi:hypothetical protein